MGILIILALIVIGYLVYSNYKKGSIGDIFGKEKRSPLDIAKERYARGEISREEFERLKKELS